MTLSKVTFWGCILVVSLCVVATSFAGTYSLDFPNDKDPIPQSFGDNAEANITYREIIPQFGNVNNGPGKLYSWPAGYGDLTSAAWCYTEGNRGEIRVETIEPNTTVTLDSFNIAAWYTARPASWAIYDTDWNLLAEGSGSAPSSGGHLHVEPNVTSRTGGLILQWGDNAWNVGINNVTYTVSAMPTTLPGIMLPLLLTPDLE